MHLHFPKGENWTPRDSEGSAINYIWSFLWELFDVCLVEPICTKICRYSSHSFRKIGIWNINFLLLWHPLSLFGGGSKYILDSTRLILRSVDGSREHVDNCVLYLGEGWQHHVTPAQKVANTRYTLPKTNSSPLKIGHPKRKIVFQPSIFRCELLVSGRVFLVGRWNFLCRAFRPIFRVKPLVSGSVIPL